MRFSITLLTATLSIPAFGVDPKELKPGLIGTYTNATAVARLDPLPALTLAASESSNVKWSGFIYIVTPGEYTFSANLLGGDLQVKVGETEVFRSDRTSNGKPATLIAGPQPFLATFNRSDDNSNRRVELLWEGPGFRREPIPYFFFSHHPKERGESFATDRQRERGRFLFEEQGCQNCHLPEKGQSFHERKGPTLIDVGKRVFPGWLDAWLADPKKLRPHTTMPSLFADDERGKTERYAVVQYLTSLGGPVEPRERKENLDAIKRGEKLFALSGCAACHANKPNDATRKRTDDDDPAPPYDPTNSFLGLGTANGPQSTYTFTALGSKTTLNRLTEYLLDPHKTSPHGRMPNMALNVNDARDIAQFLCKSTERSLSTVALPLGKVSDLPVSKTIPNFDQFKPDQQWRELGKRLVVSKGCVKCHEVPEDIQKSPIINYAPLAEVVKKPLDMCLSVKPDANHLPVYSFDESQRKALQAFLSVASKPTTTSPTFDARIALKRFMCLNCHTRDGEGGLAAELADKMKSLESAENADDVRPPSLTHIGHKATPEWLKEVLLNKGRARPWMGMRMPQYGEKNVGFLVDALPKLEGTVNDTAVVKPQFDAALISAGRTLTGKDGYGCIACHDISGVVGGGTRGPDLALTQQRVRPEWFERWMHNPQRLSPGTKMPQYFLDGKATNALLNADPAKQIDAFRAYFSLGMGLPLPTGLEPPKGLVIAVKDRPQLLRTFMPEGAGTRSFAVGYPGNVNIAYDSTQARVAYAWAGNFLDASPVWAGRGGNPAKLLGPKFWSAPVGHPWMMGKTLPDFDKFARDPAYGAVGDPDIAFQGEPKLWFDGYSLDEKGYVSFTSTVISPDGNPLTVVETPIPLTGTFATGFARKWRLTGGDELVWFSAGTFASKAKIVNADGKETVIGGNATQIIAPDHPLVLPQPGGKAIVFTVPQSLIGTKWHVVPNGNGCRVALAIPLTDGRGAKGVTLHTWAVPKDDAKLIRELK